jgi:phosphoglycerol transferase
MPQSDRQKTEGRPGGRPRALCTFALALGAGLIVMVWALRLWEADWTVPFHYAHGADAYFYLAMFQTVNETGWYTTNPRLGAPGMLDLHDFPNIETHAYLWGWLLASLTHNAFVSMNIFYILTFPLAIATALYVFRRFGASDGAAVAGSLLFAFATFHFYRNVTHANLSAYYPIPLVVMVALDLAAGAPLFFDRDTSGRLRWYRGGSRAIGSLLICGLIAVCGPYYSFFGALLLATGGLIAALRRPFLARFLDAALLIGVIVVLLGVQLAPFVRYAWHHGPNFEVAIRDPGDQTKHGLGLNNLLIPSVGHRLPWLRYLSPAIMHSNRFNERQVFEFQTEAIGSTPLGMVGAVGLLVLLVLAVGFPEWLERRQPVLAHLTRLNLAVLLVALVGGLSESIALNLTALIRCYNRISIVVLFMSLFTVVLLVDRIRGAWLRRGRRALGFDALLVAGTVLALLDQIPSVAAPDHSEDAARFHCDRRFVERIEMEVPHGTSIFQLPVVPFPEEPVRLLRDYDHFRGFFHSRHLRWSYGAMRGRDVLRGQAEAAAAPVPVLLERLRQAGFGGIYLNRRGFSDRAVPLVRELSTRLRQEPLSSEDGTLVFFSLRRTSSGAEENK